MSVVILIIVILLILLFIGWFYCDTRCRFKRCKSRGGSDPCGFGSGLKGLQGLQGPTGVQARQTTQFTFTPAGDTGEIDIVGAIQFAVVTFGDADSEDFGINGVNTFGGIIDRFSGIFGKSGYINNFRTFMKILADGTFSPIVSQLYLDTTSSGNVPNFLPIPELQTLTPADGNYHIKTPNTPALIPVSAGTRFALVLTVAPGFIDETFIDAFTASFDFTAN